MSRLNVEQKSRDKTHDQLNDSVRFRFDLIKDEIKRIVEWTVESDTKRMKLVSTLEKAYVPNQTSNCRICKGNGKIDEKFPGTLVNKPCGRCKGSGQVMIIYGKKDNNNGEKLYKLL